MGLEKELQSRKAVNIVELAQLRLLHERVPFPTPKHTAILLYITKDCFYKTPEEISLAIGIQNGKLQKILSSLAKKNLVHKTGCLYKPKTSEEIQKII